jgi:DNA invertase Pin-like site-specific DNA recombinase
MPLSPASRIPICDQSLGHIEVLAGQIAELQSKQHLAVARARASGATWSEIARALGCSVQAAHKRYRWMRHSEHPPQVWFERPLQL